MKNNDYSKFESVPEDKEERLNYLFDKYKINEDKLYEEINKIKKNRKTNKKKLDLVFYIVPEGIARPRKGKYGFYVPNIQKFYDCMNKYLDIHEELKELNIISECKLDLRYYLPIPSDMRKYEKILAELKYIKPIRKPDWDNLGKGTDMLQRLMLDDSLVTMAIVRKFYSFKPRIEVRITYFTNSDNSYHELCIKKMKSRLKK